VGYCERVRDLVLVISDKPDVERDAVAAVWEAEGGEVLRLGRFWDPPALDRARVRVYGADAFCLVLAQKLALELVSPPDDLLLALDTTLTRRMLRGLPLADARTLGWPCFVKSMVPKLIRAQVYRSDADLLAASKGLPGDTLLLASEIVAFEAEARAWTLDGDVLAIACYEGASELADARALARSIAAHAPSPCVIDVGLTTDRGWVAIEANAAWGSGLNGCDPLAAARCIARATR
jgi:hypothetical protein